MQLVNWTRTFDNDTGVSKHVAEQRNKTSLHSLKYIHENIVMAGDMKVRYLLSF
jgi:hypothetical protein